MTLQTASAFISAMVTLFAAFCKLKYKSILNLIKLFNFFFEDHMVDNRNTVASGLGFIGYLIAWFPIFYFSSNHAKRMY